MSRSMSASVEQLVQMADDAFRDGEFEDAIALCDQLLERDAKHPDALELKGMALGELGEFEQADAIFEKLLQQQPRMTTALIAAAHVKIRLPGDDRERIAEGLALLDRADPVARRDEELSIQVEILRGVAFNQLGDNEDALDSFARVLQLDPEHPEARLEQAVAFFELGRFDDARRAFERIVKDEPQEAWAHHHLGLLAERRGEDPEPYFARARKLEPDEFPRPPALSREEFDRAVAEAIDRLPEHAKPHLANVVISVEPLPGEEELNDGLSPTILGVFAGTPITERLDTHAGHHETARIKLFQKNLERFARSREELLEEIGITVLHEVGHLLGLDEDELYDRGLD
jgi:predicted Zn-dependent protease with MMP-like domain/Flp pilus assembly protein TadD